MADNDFNIYDAAVTLALSSGARSHRGLFRAEDTFAEGRFTESKDGLERLVYEHTIGPDESERRFRITVEVEEIMPPTPPILSLRVVRGEITFDDINKGRV